jgi:NodT family efflux transporter outer membrane factor (OMF) lipoprotein
MRTRASARPFSARPLSARPLAPARFRGRAALALLLTALPWSGCNLAPKYDHPPTTPVAQTTAFKEATVAPGATAVGWKPAQPQDDRIRMKWWELYGDPTLSALEERVAVSNQTLLAAEANYRLARAMVVAARSQLYPTATLGPSFQRQRTSTTTARSSSGTAAGGSTAGTSGSGPNPYNTFTVPVDASYEVDLWDRVRNTLRAAAATAQASAADVATALLSTQAQLAQDYFELRALDTERQLFADAIAADRKALALTRTLFSTGIDSDEDVANAETQLATVTAQATDVGVARAQYEHALAVLLGQSPSEFSLPAAPFSPQPPPVPLGLPSELLQRRPDIAAAERQVASANANIGVARAAYFPSLTLSASAGFSSSSLSQLFNWPSRIWSFGPQLSGTIFDVGGLRAVTEEAQATYDQTVANYRQTVLAGFQAVEDNLSALRILGTEAVQQREAVAAADHYLKLALTRYQTGIDSYLNVTTAQTALLTNRQTELQIQLRQMTASVNLIVALGGGWDASQLPTMKQMIQRPPKWSPAN